MTSYVGGLDLSLRAAGITLLPTDWAEERDWRRPVVRTVGLALPKDASHWERAHRIAAMSRAIVDFLSGFDVEKVWFEGYAFTSQQTQAFSLGELGGAVKTRLFDAGIRLDVAAPATARVHLGTFSKANGRGPVKKQVYDTLVGLGMPKDWTGDEADAFVIANHGIVVGGFGGIEVERVAKMKSPRGKRGAGQTAGYAEVIEEGLF